VFAIDPLEEPSSRPQTFVITTARNQDWLEDRSEPAILESGERVGDPGVLVRVGPSPDLRTVNVPTLANLLLVDPAKRGRPNLQAGDRFVEPGMFSVTLLESGASEARLRFSWLDHTPPSAPPNLSVRTVVGGLLRVGWSPSKETGSGVAYTAFRSTGALRSGLQAGRSTSPRRFPGSTRASIRLASSRWIAREIEARPRCADSEAVVDAQLRFRRGDD
jgi:hypothetical protein